MQKYLAEFVGTMFLALVVLTTSGDALPVAASLAVAIMVVGKVSGGHLNPALTMMMAVGKKMNKNDVMPYVLAQVAGAVVALELHKRVR